MKTKEDFDAFAAAALSTMDDTENTEYWATERNILDCLLSQARSSLFGQEIKDEAEHAEYLKLKAKFEQGEKQMKNPMPTTGFVATPDSLDDLMEYCERFSGQEKAIAMLVATMTLNLAHKVFNEATQGETK